VRDREPGQSSRYYLRARVAPEQPLSAYWSSHFATVLSASARDPSIFLHGHSLVIDLAQVPPVPWAWVDERVYAAIRGCSVKLLQNERRLNIGCPFRRVNGTSIRYKLGDIWEYLESQPGGGGNTKLSPQFKRKRGRPRRFST
jgi:hypothetical protein